MDFRHSDEIWRDFPQLVAGVAFATGISPDAAPDDSVTRFTAIAKSRLAGATESELPEIQAWRRAFTTMGLKPTQYRCASEALLRRFRKEGTLPRLHPLVDVCNAASLAFAVPVAVFDVAAISGSLRVRYAAGDGQTSGADPGLLQRPTTRDVGEGRSHPDPEANGSGDTVAPSTATAK